MPEPLQDILAAYLRYRWPRWQPHRAAENVMTLSRQLTAIWSWFANERQVNDCELLVRSDVEAWLTARAEQGMSVGTRCTQLTILFGCLRFACDQDKSIAANIFRIPPPTRTDPLPRYLSEVDYEQLLKTVESQTADSSPRNLFDRAWFLTLAQTGLRSCELTNLRLHDIDLSNRRLIVRGSKTYHDRVIFLTPSLIAALTAYLAVRPATADDHLWIDGTRRLTAVQVRRTVARWGVVAQVAVSPHRLRHTFATRLANSGMPLSSIGKLLGHRSLTSTQHYARLYEHTLKSQFEAASAHIEGILAPDWPQFSQPDLHFLELLADSV